MNYAEGLFEWVISLSKRKRGLMDLSSKNIHSDLSLTLCMSVFSQFRWRQNACPLYIEKKHSCKVCVKGLNECFYSKDLSTHAFAMKEKNPLNKAFSVIHRVLRLGLVIIFCHFYLPSIENSE